jgi:hypothetical protein
MKTILARALSDVAFALLDLSSALVPYDDGKTKEDHEIKAEAFWARINAHKEHPCPECSG